MGTPLFVVPRHRSWFWVHSHADMWFGLDVTVTQRRVMVGCKRLD